MGKQLTYQTDNHFRWFLAISLAISLFSYTGYVDTAEACQPQPHQVEWVFSGQNNVDSGTISYHQIFAPELSHKPVKRSREYEAYVQAVHQSRIKVAMEAILERSTFFPRPVLHQQTITVLYSSEESSSDISG